LWSLAAAAVHMVVVERADYFLLLLLAFPVG